MREKLRDRNVLRNVASSACRSIFSSTGTAPIDFDLSVMLDGLAIFRRSACRHSTTPRTVRLRGAQRRQRQQRVIDGSQRGSRNQQHGQLQVAHQVRHQLLLVDGNQRAARAFHDQSLALRQCRGMRIFCSSMRTPARRAARCGETGGAKQ